MTIDKDTLDKMLKDIETTGASHEDNKTVHLVLGSRNHLNHILNLSSGMPRIRNNVIDRFSLILSQPLALQALNPFEIRCCLCKEVISYPAWYYSVRYVVNHFHYLICFDANSTMKPTAKCYKR